jgi:hypothetical protein
LGVGGQIVEFFGTIISSYESMAVESGLQVLSEGQDVTIDITQVVERLMKLIDGFSQADHQP